MAGLLDGLQGGGSYPQVAPTGRNLWDLLASAVSSDPSQYASADAAQQAADAKYAAAQQQADANLGAALTPVATKAANGNGSSIYAMGTPDPTATAALMPGSGAPMGFGAPDASTSQSAPAVAAPTTPRPAPAPARQAANPSVVNPVNLPPLQQQQTNDPSMAPGVMLNDDGSVASQAGTNDVGGAPTDGQTAAGVAAGQLQDAVQSPEQSQSLLQGFADQAKGIADKLTNLSPNASQALIASGLATLAANDGSRNLGQVVGIGGAAGLNNFMTNTQMQARNQLAAAKLAQEQYLKVRQQNLEDWKAQNTPTVVKAGESVITPGGFANGNSGTQIGGAAVAGTRKYQDANGNEFEQGVDYAGRPVGQPFMTKQVDTGALTDGQRQAIAAANTAADEQTKSLGLTSQYLKQLSPTMVDASGKTVPNPNYVSVPGGLAGSANDAWTRLTGSYSAGQQLRAQIANNATLGQLAQYKEGVGGRLTNNDVSILQKGLPIEGADSKSLYNYLTAYGKLQQSAAERSQLQAAYLSANRGDQSELRHDLTVGGVTYPKGSTWEQVYQGKVGSPAAQGTSTPSGAAPGNGNINQHLVAGAQAAARNGDQTAQAALKKYGITW